MAMICKVDKLKNVDGASVAVDLKMTAEELKDISDVRLAGGTLDFSGTAENLDRVITVTGTVRCCFDEVCDRCGAPVSVPFEGIFEESFTNVEEKADDGFSADEEPVYFFEGDEIDLFPYVEQSVFLQKPMKTLCSEDCKGLCPQCGINLNENECSCEKSPIDPRFAVLADLLNKG